MSICLRFGVQRCLYSCGSMSRNRAVPLSTEAPIGATVGLLHRDNDLALSVSFFEIAERLGRLAQRVGPVDDRRDCPSFD